MGDSTIEWTDKTWNPLTGCTRVSEGCNNCYAFQLHDQRHIAWKRGRWDAAPAQYHKPFSQVQMFDERLTEPFRWRQPAKVFVNSMSDVFHPDVPDRFLDQVFTVMEATPRHTFQVLTKRPERMAAYMQRRVQQSPTTRPAEHIWLGTSVENQQSADERIPHLLRTPAAVRFLSCEPLLGPVDLAPWLHIHEAQTDRGLEWMPNPIHQWDLQWAIAGGESGPHARPMDLDWLRDLIRQCRAAGVPVFVKQLGTAWAKAHGVRDRHGGDPDEWPADLRIRQFPASGGV